MALLRGVAADRRRTSVESVAEGYWTCGVKMDESGIAANMCSIAEICYLPARPVVLDFQDIPTDQRRPSVIAQPPIRPVRSVRMDG